MFLAFSGYCLVTRYNLNSEYQVGNVVDHFNEVEVFYNGGVNQVAGRNLTADGYNLGLKYQCVEFVKRYYYQRFNHKMPDSYGHAKSFFDTTLPDGAINSKRMLQQFKNGSANAPMVEDIIVFDAWALNPYGHVAIITKVNERSIEVIQQNPGQFGSSRDVLPLEVNSDRWTVADTRVLGWLRKEKD
jgi:surface antigen